MPPRNAPENPRLDSLLDQIDEAFADAAVDRALALCEEALLLAPRSIDALHYRAAALRELGRAEDAHEAYLKALKSAPDDLDVLRGAIELLAVDFADDHDALDDALDLSERALKLARKTSDPEVLTEFLLLAGLALDARGEFKPALAVLDEAAALSPEKPEAALQRGIGLFQLLRLDEAKKELERCLSLEPELATAHHYLGLVAERRRDLKTAQRHFDKARKLAPDDFPRPVELSAEEFDKAVKDALEQLPERVRKHLKNVTISVRDIPNDEDLAPADPPLSPESLGIFIGNAITERRLDDPLADFPVAIALFQKNLQRACATREELLDQIGVTLVHEVGHLLGLDEEDLWERGLD